MMTELHAGLDPVEPPYPQALGETLRSMSPRSVEPLNLFRAVAHNPALLDAFSRFGSYFLTRGELTPIDRELVIARTTVRCDSSYEWAVHAHFFSGRVGLSRAQLEATLQARAATSNLFDARQQLLISLVDQLHDTSKVTPGLWQSLQDEWSPARLVELVALVGQYHLVSFLANALGVAPEDYLDAELLGSFQDRSSASSKPDSAL